MRFIRLSAVATGAMLALGVLPLGQAAIAQNTGAPRVAFQIATGSSSGIYFPLGELLAQMISHPPGIGRCESGNVCGPPGLIVSTRASEGSVANVTAVRVGNVSSGLAQADVVAEAVKGTGPFKKDGPAKDLRVIGNLFGEDVYVLAAKDSKIASVADLRGKRVSLSSEGSGTIITARAILSAYRMSERSVKANYDDADAAADLLQAGKLDAMFYIGAPSGLVSQLLDEGVAKLVPIDGAGRKRLLEREPYLSAATIPAAPAGSPAVDTVSVDALWITDASQPDDLIYGIVRALYNPANRNAFDVGRIGEHFLDREMAATNLTAPLHPGAARFFTELGVLKSGSKPASPPVKKS
jgi:uncharacterized protein